MAYRTVVLNQATKINLNLNNIVVYYEQEKYFIDLDEINLIIIEDPRCLVSLKLITEIGEKGITMLFVNSSHLPICSLETLGNNARMAKRYKEQINWDKEAIKYLWTRIIANKIEGQKRNLLKVNHITKINLMDNYLSNIKINDITNREGLASRTYFKEFFGNDFKRFSEDIINFSLNYTYQIVRAKIAQEIVALGYNPCLGINHTSEYNSFNLADDFIEIYRPIIDYYVYEVLNETDSKCLTPAIKEKLINIINMPVIYDGNNQKIHLSISLYINNITNFLNTGNMDKIIFPILL